MLDGFTAETLARVQFAFTISFHIIFPAFSIGLASYLAVLNGLWLRTKDETYLILFNYWKKIFAVAFGMGVVSGIVMSCAHLSVLVSRGARTWGRASRA